MNILNFAAVAAVGIALALSPGQALTQAAAEPVSLGVAFEPGEEGLQVAKVLPDRGGEALGFKVGDIVLEAGGEPISPEVLLAYMKQSKPGDKLSFKVQRAGAILDLSGKAMATPAGAAAPNLQPVEQPAPAKQSDE